MKALELESGLILKEKTRQTDRYKNNISVVLSVKVEYGTTITEALAGKETELIIYVDKNSCESLWNRMKDTTVDNMISLIFEYKDFEHIIKDVNEVENNNAEYETIFPLYETVITYLKQFDNIQMVEI